MRGGGIFTSINSKLGSPTRNKKLSPTVLCRNFTNSPFIQIMPQITKRADPSPGGGSSSAPCHQLSSYPVILLYAEHRGTWIIHSTQHLSCWYCTRWDLVAEIHFMSHTQHVKMLRSINLQPTSFTSSPILSSLAAGLVSTLYPGRGLIIFIITAGYSRYSRY